MQPRIKKETMMATTPFSKPGFHATVSLKQPAFKSNFFVINFYKSVSLK